VVVLETEWLISPKASIQAKREPKVNSWVKTIGWFDKTMSGINTLSGVSDFVKICAAEQVRTG